MPKLSHHHLWNALGKEGEVTLWRSLRSGHYHVIFRLGGKQFNRSTGTAVYGEAQVRGATIFAEVVRGPQETAILGKLNAKIEAMAFDLKHAVECLAGGNVRNGVPLVSTKEAAVKTVGEAVALFLEYKKTDQQNSKATLSRDSRRLALFADFIGEKTALNEIKTEDLDRFARRKEANGARATENDLDVALSLIRWAAKPKRRWCSPDLAGMIEIKSVKRKGNPIEIITLGQARKILSWVEAHAPNYALFYALAILAGMRASKDLRGDGEILRLAADVKKDGWPRWWKGRGNLYVRRKTGGIKRCHCPLNLQAWLQAYSDRDFEVPDDNWHRRHVVGPFEVKRNAFRHTACSAFVSSGGNLGAAAILFDNSEAMLKRHYVDLFEREEALGFYEIYPTGWSAAPEKDKPPEGADSPK